MPSASRTATILLAIIGLALFALAGRLVHINTAMAARLQAVVEKQQVGCTPIPARRGLIFDSRGRIAAGSEEVPSIFADPGLIEDLPAAAAALAPALGLDAGKLEDLIRNSDTPRFCWVKRRVGPAEAEAVRSLESPGFGIINESMRRYPLGTSLAHVLGFVGQEGRGLEGMELKYDAHLRGSDGRIESIRDVRRRSIWRLEEATVAVQDGGHLVLTIDSAVQSVVEDQLKKQVTEFKAESGVAVVISPKTGDVLAMACYPTFDPAEFNDADKDARRNRVVTDPVEPGSTFKPVVASAALAGRYVSTTESIYCHQGVMVLNGRTLRDTKPHGDLTLEGIIARSSNIGMAQIAERMGDDALYQALKGFGFGEPTGIELPGEGGGMLMPRKLWSSQSAASVGMGYEIGVTPLQLAVAYCAVVNGGVLLKPRLVRATMAADGTVTEVFQGPQPLRRILPEEVSRFFTQQAMVAVVNATGDKDLCLADYQLAGKTGTTKLAYRGRKGYEPDAYLSSFCATAPAEDPELVTLVMVRRPYKPLGYYGRTVAAPAVREIMGWTLAYLGVPPNPPPPTKPPHQG